MANRAARHRNAVSGGKWMRLRSGKAVPRIGAGAISGSSGGTVDEVGVRPGRLPACPAVRKQQSHSQRKEGRAPAGPAQTNQIQHRGLCYWLIASFGNDHRFYQFIAFCEPVISSHHHTCGAGARAPVPQAQRRSFLQKRIARSPAGSQIVRFADCPERRESHRSSSPQSRREFPRNLECCSNAG